MRKRTARNLETTDPTTVHVLYVQGPADGTDPRNKLKEHLKSIRSVRRYEYDDASGKLLVLGHISIVRLTGLLEEAGFQVNDEPFMSAPRREQPAAVEAMPAVEEAAPRTEDAAVDAAEPEEPPAEQDVAPAAQAAQPAVDDTPAVSEAQSAVDEAAPAAEEAQEAVEDDAATVPEEAPAAAIEPERPGDETPVADAAQPTAAETAPTAEPVAATSDWRTRLFFMASISFLGGLAISFSPAYWTVAFPLLVLAMVLAGVHPAAGALAALRTGRLDMNVLMCVVGLGAAFLGAWQEGAFVLVLYALSDVLESRGMLRPRRCFQRSLALIPAEAARLVDFDASAASEGNLDEIAEEIVPLESVSVGDYIKVLPGQRIPFDGVVSYGASLVSEVDVTGQAIPVVKDVHSKVYAGSLNEQSELVVKVERPAGESTLDRVFRLTERAAAVEVPLQRNIARLTTLVIPIMIYLASFGIVLIPPLLFGQAFHPWLYRGLMVLVMALPSALLVSVPIVVVSALFRSARGGILIRSSHVLARLAELTTMAFETRGVLTRREMVLADIIAFGDIPETEALQVAASIGAMRSQTIDPDADDKVERKMVQGLIHAAAASNIPLLPIENFSAEPGRGFEGTVVHPAGTWHFRIGSPEWMIDEAYALDDDMNEAIRQLRESGKVVWLVADKIGIFAAIAMEEPVREESRRLLERLRRLGIRRTAMLTSAEALSAHHVAWQIGIEDIHAEQGAPDKNQLIQEWRQAGEKVAVVYSAEQSDADVDAADVRIVIGKTEWASDESADVVMLADEVARLSSLFALARRARGKIKQNLALALLSKLVVALLIVSGQLHLWLAITVEFVATMLVIGNGLLLLRSRI